MQYNNPELSALWNWSPILAIRPYVFQVFVIAAAAFVLSFGVTFLIGKIPGAKYLVGRSDAKPKAFRHQNRLFK